MSRVQMYGFPPVWWRLTRRFGNRLLTARCYPRPVCPASYGIFVLAPHGPTQQDASFQDIAIDFMDQGVLVVAPDLSVPVLNLRATELLDLPPEFAVDHPSFPEILAYQVESGAITAAYMNSSINGFILRGEAVFGTHTYTRLSDLLELGLKHPTRLALLKKIPATSLRELHDDVLLRELSRDDNESRIVFALRCVQALPKSRVAGLLDRYVDADAQRYYNSIHWLDLGASLPTRIAKSVAARALEQR